MPFELIDEVSLLGPRERIADRIEAWKESGVGTLIVGGGGQAEAMEILAELVL